MTITSATQSADQPRFADLTANNPAILFDGLLRWLPTALLLVNEAGGVVHLNDRGAALLHLTSPCASSLQTIDQLPDWLAPLQTLLTETPMGQDRIREELEIHVPGLTEPRMIGYTLRHEPLPGVGMVRALVFNDITDILKEKAAAEQIRQELFQTKKMASMGHLITGVAHELNNPLVAIHMSAQLSRRSVERLLDDAQKNLLRLTPQDWLVDVKSSLSRTLSEVARVEGATRQATALVSDLLNYSRPGRLELELLDMAAFIQDLLAQWRNTLFQLPGIELALDTPAIPILIEVDRIKMEQVFYHLLKNAVEAHRPGQPPRIGIRFVVQYQADNPQQSRLLIKIQDDGVGLSAELIERAMEPFFTTKGGNSTGLGLSQAYVTVERHGGQLTIDSQPDQGATLTIALPYPGARAVEAGL